MTIEERSNEYAYGEFESVCKGCQYWRSRGYVAGATEQREIDIEKACEALYGLANDLGCDLMDIDKAKEYMRKAMEKE